MKVFFKLLMAGMIMFAVGCGGSDSDDESKYVTIKNTSQLSSSVIIGVEFYGAGSLGSACTWTGGNGMSIPAGGKKTFEWIGGEVIDIKVEFSQGGPNNLWYASCMRSIIVGAETTLEFAKDNE